MNILQVNAIDNYGGAARIAWNLFQSYRNRGHRSWLAVGHKGSDDPDVHRIPNDECRTRWALFWINTGRVLAPFASRIVGAGLLRNLLTCCIGQTRRWLKTLCGHEDFDFPGTWRLLDLPPERPDILHCHNLLGGYFDLRALPWLSRQLPIVLTLHDTWPLSGHCGHSLGCERWKTGCGNCPDLTIYPSIRRDATAYNWRRKEQIYLNSKLHVATPSQWLMEKVEQSMLSPAIVEAKVIPNGVDLSVFRPGNKKEARRSLSIPQEAKVVVSMLKGKRGNVWQDFNTMRQAIVRAAEYVRGGRLQCIVLGLDKVPERVGQAEFFFLAYQKPSESVARYLQAADICVHSATADTFPNTVLEALACGTPVVATAVGGIPEQVKTLEITKEDGADRVLSTFGVDDATGVLVPPKDASTMAKGIEILLNDEELRCRIGKNGARDARERFDLDRHVRSYLQWYERIVEKGG